MTDYKNKLGNLANKLKTEQPKMPIQEVTPIKQKIKEEEAQLNVWIPKVLLKKVKSHGIEHDLSLKEMAIQALTAYINA
ncbi:hypothetical protein GS399_15830 [Pedobacter sp. HMF7647]|uniref:CopG family transcriptional regulator n=1 Tax=Hufsiella arboris TaxID=2695275 RepID=A0A7K1YCZ7_9SPHI|nr:hypothetical protein [Hufsiella arboris]MXV52445.1 hypothetical protein [Hufsiella arboris]